VDNQPQIFKISGHTVRVLFGDLASLREPVDAIVSSDNNYLSHGAGVSRALWTAAGPELEQFVEAAKPQLHLGDVYVTPGFRLPCRFLLHAVSIDLDQNRSILEPELPKLYQRIFESAGAEKCAEVALPLIGAGSAGLSPRASATSFVDTLTSGFPSYRGVRKVQLALFGPEDRIAQEILEAAERRERDLEGSVEELIDSTEGEIGHSLRQAWHQYLSGEPSARGVALALFFGHVQDLLQEHSSDAGQEPHQLWRSAWLARNRLAHSRGHWDAHDWSTLLGAVREGLIAARSQKALRRPQEEPFASEAAKGKGRDEDVLPSRTADGESEEPTVAPSDRSSHSDAEATDLLASADAAFAHLSPSRAGSAPRPSASQAPLGLSFDGATRQRPQLSSTSPLPVSPPSERERGVGRGTTPLRELRDFLISHLPEASREDLRRRFMAHGYKGPEEIQLLEFLIREPDLVGFIASEFGRPALLAAIRKFRSEEPPDCPTAERLARWFLKTLGFPDPVRPDGLKAVRQAVQRARANLLVHDDEALRGAVADVARRLEYVARVMLRFVAQAAYRTAPEQLLRNWERLPEGQDLGKASLGPLLIWIEVLDKQLEKDTIPEVALFKRDVAPTSLLPSGADGIAALRNAFSHYRPHDAGRPLAEQGRKFLDEADAFLEYLSRPEARVFPRIILIESIQYDRWGRQVISAVDDEGNHERIFTDEAVLPGQTYFMHPLTNPLRVDPILVPAGDLLWLDG
jgi:O-acetyl-ADP-ribose deacetylase (regulator of RNase III)